MNRSRQWWLRLAQITAVVALFGLALWRLDLNGLADALGAANPLIVALVVALNLVIVALFALRAGMVMRAMGYSVPWQVLAPAAILGNVAGALTPASAGEILRIEALRTYGGVTTDDAIGSVLFERALSLYFMVLGTAAAAAVAFASLRVAVPVVVISIMLAVVPFAFAPLLRHLSPGADDAGRWIAARRRIGSVASGIQALLQRRSLALPWTAATISIQATATLQFWLLANTVGDGVSPLESWLALGVSQLAGILSLIPLGLGAADGSLTALLERFGMTLEQGAAVALLVRAASTLPLIIAAFISYVWLVRRAPARQEGAATPQPSAPR